MLLRPDGNKHARAEILIHDSKAPLKHVLLTDNLDNGNVGITAKADFVTGEREVYKLTKPTTALITAKVAKEDIVIIHAPEVIYDETRMANTALKNFYNTAGETVRAYPLSVVRRFQLSVEGFTSAPTVGQFVILQNNSWKLAPSASLVDGATVGKCVRIDTHGIPTHMLADGSMPGSYSMYVIEVL